MRRTCYKCHGKLTFEVHLAHCDNCHQTWPQSYLAEIQKSWTFKKFASFCNHKTGRFCELKAKWMGYLWFCGEEICPLWKKRKAKCIDLPLFRCGLCGFSEAWGGDGDLVWECPKCAAAYHALTGE